MKYTKKNLAELDHCYAVNVMDVQGEPYAFFAAENHGPCFAVDCASGGHRLEVWQQPGGTMGMVPIPGRSGEFLAVQRFFRLYDWEEACLVWVKPDGMGSFAVRELFTLPYLHRFDILERSGKLWLVVCTLAAHKQTREDWSTPGSVYVAPFPQDWDESIQLQKLLGDCYRNHGYARQHQKGYDVGIVTCDSGVFEITPPGNSEGAWQVSQLATMAASDADFVDIDGDGELEMATIEPFHGQYFRIYKRVNGCYQQVFQHPEVTEFYHVVKAGTLAGKPCFVGGCRRGLQQLFVITWDAQQQRFVVDTVDSGVGPSNVCLYHGPKGDVIYSANRESAQAAAYAVEE